MRWRNWIFLAASLAIAGGILSRLLQQHPLPQPRNYDPHLVTTADFSNAVQALDQAFNDDWADAKLNPTPPAPALAVVRRLSLGLTGTLPSLQEIRALQTRPEETWVQWWLAHLFEDPRYSDYLAERFARAFVGVENGPFLVYRRRRLVNWLSNEFRQNRPYDRLVRSLIAAEGIWTTHPEVNFITVSIDQNEKKGPDEAKLAARVTRAFLGLRLDCVQCHDDKFGDRWKQSHFHELAAFFGPAKMSLRGLREGDDPYKVRYHGRPEEEVVAPTVPFCPDLIHTDEGTLRAQLASWVTHPSNSAFARATVNRVWALLFNHPLVEPVDHIPLEGPYPPGLELLARDLAAHQFDLQRLIRVIAASRVFGLDSCAAPGAVPPTAEHRKHFAAFPMTRLRPEQVAGSLLQASSLATIDGDSHFILQFASAVQEGKFIERFGDLGEDEFAARGGTIPQRLLLMNGELVQERTKDNPFINAAHRILMVAPDHLTAVRTLYLTTLSRPPSLAEEAHFVDRLDNAEKKSRLQEMQDLQWALLNSTEFSWNH